MIQALIGPPSLPTRPYSAPTALPGTCPLIYPTSYGAPFKHPKPYRRSRTQSHISIKHFKLEYHGKSEFQHHVTHMDVGTAPGWTGFTHAMMRCWPEPLLREVHSILQSFGSADYPDWWSFRLMSPIQKIQGSTSLDSLRPIMLLEVVRKVWTTLLHRKIAHAWENFNLLAAGQAGGRPRHGTEAPIMQLIAYIDHRRQTVEATFITFWDISKAFDSPSKNVLKASLARLAVPPQWADWFVSMDMRGGVLPKSPIAQDFLHAGHRPSEAPPFDQANEQPGIFRSNSTRM